MNVIPWISRARQSSGREHPYSSNHISKLYDSHIGNGDRRFKAMAKESCVGNRLEK